MNGYIAIYGERRLEVYAPTIAEARRKALAELKPRRPGLLSVTLAELDGKPVTHLPLF